MTMIYLDNAATTPVDPDVLETFNQACRNFWANPHSLHQPGERAEQLLQQSRNQITELLGGTGYQTVFLSGATEANNLAIRGVTEQKPRRGNHVITTNTEHASVENVVQYLEARGYNVTRLPVGPDGTVTSEQVEAAVTDETVLVSIMYVNNETGAINPVREIAGRLAPLPLRFHVDAAQAVGKLAIRLEETPIDLLTFSAHKFGGLKGSGALVMRSRHAITPQLLGGGQEFGLRSGTVNVPAAAALAKALRLATERLETSSDRVARLNMILREHFSSLDGIVCNSPPSASPYILNISVEGIRPETVLHALGEARIYVSTVSACSSRKTQYSRTVLAMTGDEKRAEHTLRLSLSHATTESEIQRVTECVTEIIGTLR